VWTLARLRLRRGTSAPIVGERSAAAHTSPELRPAPFVDLRVEASWGGSMLPEIRELPGFSLAELLAARRAAAEAPPTVIDVRGDARPDDRADVTAEQAPLGR
jgi:hypothetical protein